MACSVAVFISATDSARAAGTEAALARVVTVFGAAHPHHAYLFDAVGAAAVNAEAETPAAQDPLSKGTESKGSN